MSCRTKPGNCRSKSFSRGTPVRIGEPGRRADDGARRVALRSATRIRGLRLALCGWGGLFLAIVSLTGCQHSCCCFCNGPPVTCSEYIVEEEPWQYGYQQTTWSSWADGNSVLGSFPAKNHSYQAGPEIRL